MTYTGVSSDRSNGLLMWSTSLPALALVFDLAGSRALGLLQQCVPRVLARCRLAEGLQRLPGRPAHLLRHLHLNGDQQIAGGPVGAPHALAADPEGPAVRRAGRDAHADRRAP